MQRTEFTWCVDGDLAACRGHFPGRPIVPGAVLLDRALLFAAAIADLGAGGWQVAQAKFLHPVTPGTVLSYALQAYDDGRIAFTLHAGSLVVATGSLKHWPP